MTDKLFLVEVTAGAKRDLDEIQDYLEVERSASESDAFLADFGRAARTPKQFPLRGSVPRELDALGIREFRQVMFGPYRVIYDVVGPNVFIMVVADGRRDMQSLLERRLLHR